MHLLHTVRFVLAEVPEPGAGGWVTFGLARSPISNHPDYSSCSTLRRVVFFFLIVHSLPTVQKTAVFVTVRRRSSHQSSLGTY